MGLSMGIQIIKYSSDKKSEWDNFVKNAKNGHFIFFRDYMEYHSDRFEDFSLMVYKDDDLISCLPANIKNNVLYTHQGLTFGGFITNERISTPLMLEVFETFINFCRKHDIKEVVYKSIPYIYHKFPANEDSYALFINNAVLWRRDVTVTIDYSNRIEYQERRRRSIKKAKKNNILILQSEDYKDYWEILSKNLYEKYKTKPVHSLEEIVKLHSLFPENIVLFVALYENNIVAGVVMYINEIIAHCQYIASNDIGKEIGALDLLFDYLIAYYSDNKKYFDFGISNEQDGRYLNKGLIEYKEGFGARAVCHDFYKIILK